MASRRLSVLNPSDVSNKANVSGPRPSRKSFGTALPPGSAASSAGPSVKGLALTHLYQTVVKMSTENKINEKNSWTLPLIDHMERIISGDARKKPVAAAPVPFIARGGAAVSASAPAAAAPAAAAAAPAFGSDDGGLIASADAALLNFQRASCTLDATVRIWSCRVDDVWNSSHRVLENIARGGEAVPPEDADGTGGESGARSTRKSAASAAVAAAASADDADAASGCAAWSPGTGTTLESDPGSLRQARVDVGVVVDPLFAKMSADCGGGSEGGAAGLLLARLSVSGGCHLAFDSGDAGDVDTARSAGIGLSGEAALLPAEIGDELRRIWEASMGVAHGDASALDAALKAKRLAPTLDALYSALYGYIGQPSSAAHEAPPAEDAAKRAAESLPNTGEWATVSALAATETDKAQEPIASVPPPASPESATLSQAATAVAAATAAALAPIASIDAVELARATAVAITRDAGDEDAADFSDVGEGFGGHGWDETHDGETDAVAAAASSEDAGEDETVTAPTWRDVVREAASPGPKPAAAHRASLAAFEAHAGDALAAPVVVDLASLAIAPRVGPRTGAGAAWKFRGKVGAPEGTADAAAKARPKARAVAGLVRRRAPGGPDYSTPGAVPPPEAWALAGRAAISLTAPARARMAASASAAGNDLPEHAALALYNSQTQAPVSGQEVLALWSRLTLRADVVCPHAPSRESPLWPQSAAAAAMPSSDNTQDTLAARDAVDTVDNLEHVGDDESAGDMRDDGQYDWGAAAEVTPPDGGETSADVADSTAGASGSASATVDSTTGLEAVSSTVQEQQSTQAAPASLVGAVRHVEKIRVRYETTSKRVDVAALKRGFWGNIADARKTGRIGTVTHVAQEKAARVCAAKRAAAWEDVSGAAVTTAPKGGQAPAAGQDDLSAVAHGTPLALSQVIADLAPVNSQQVTVAFYFITLLHLANEHGLALTSAPGLADLGIRDLKTE